MKPTSTCALLAAVGILAALSSPKCWAYTTNATTNPFGLIAKRNVFGLRQPPSNPPPEAPKPPINIKLTGFTKEGTQGTRVLLAEVPKDPKEQMKYFNLGVGEAKDGVEVVRIHPGQVAVDVVIDGTPEELTVKSNSFLTGPVMSQPMTGRRR